MELKFECPACGQHISATPAQIGVTAPCPNCKAAVTVPARQDDDQAVFVLPTKLPFLKSHRKKILQAKVSELVSLGPIDESIEAKLQDFAVALGLKKADATAVLTGRFATEFEPIKRRMESSFVLTDSDVEEIETLKKKYNVNLTLSGTAPFFRAIYLLESKHELPPLVPVDLFLDANETCYYTTPTTWHQSRVQARGYSGTSVSLPTGIRGVRFRFGGYTPVRTEQMTPLAAGTLLVTSKRLLFNGDSRNTTISLKKIVDGHVFSDSVKIEKNTGKPDLFTMNAAQARFVLSLVGVLKEHWMHVYEVRPRKDHRGVNLISDALPFGRLWYGEPDAVTNAIGYAQFYGRSHDAVIRVYDDAGNVIETHEHAGEFKEW